MKIGIGKGIELDVDLARIESHPAVREHVWYIGLRNILMDSHATHTKAVDGEEYVENSRAAAERKLEALYNGETRSAGQREIDPVKIEANRFAVAQVKKHLKQIGKEADGKTVRELAAKLIDKNPSIMKTAKKRVDAARTTEIDMSGII